MIDKHKFHKELHEALLDAYNHASFRELLYLEFGEHLEQISNGKNFSTVILDVIQHMERNDQTLELLEKAQKKNQTNKLLYRLVHEDNLNPNVAEVDAEVEKRLYSGAFKLQMLGDLGRALQIYENLEKRNPDYPELRLRMHEIKIEMERPYVKKMSFIVSQERIIIMFNRSRINLHYHTQLITGMFIEHKNDQWK